MSWASENLSPGQRREIAEGLIAEGGGKVTRREVSRGELIGLCPLHQESNPSFSYNYEKDLYNCSSGCGGGDLIKLYGQVRGLSNREAFKAFQKKYGLELHQGGGGSGGRRSQAPPLKPAPKPEKIIPESELQKLEELPEKWIAKLEATRGWTPEVIKRLGIMLYRGPGPARIAIPIRNANGDLVNIRLYRPGAAENKVISWSMGQGEDKINFGDNRLWPVGG